MLRESAKRYWQGLAGRASAPLERTDEPEQEIEGTPAPNEGGLELGRRGFFGLMALSAAAFGAACSRSPVGKIVPYVQKPEEVTPGVSAYYASSCGACAAGCGIVLKTRDGRPIKVEGNELHPLSHGGTCAVGQASVLSLYDAARVRGPSASGRAVPWATLDSEVEKALARFTAEKRAIRVVTPRDLGPTAEAALAVFLSAHPTARRVRHETDALDAIAEAHLRTHGRRTIPRYQLDRAAFLVGIDADFLGTWLSPVTFTGQYVKSRDPASRTMSRHVHFEPKLTITGTSADRRVTLAPSDTVPLLAAITRRLLAAGRDPALTALASALEKVRAPEVQAPLLDSIAEGLGKDPGRGLLICGSEDVVAQQLTSVINQVIGAYSSSIDIATGTEVPAPDPGFEGLLDELRKGEISTLFFWGVNPVYTHPQGRELEGLLARVTLTVSTAGRLEETASQVRLLAPDHDPLESWGDVETSRGLLGLRQPSVSPLFETRSAVESFLRWAGAPSGHDDFLRARVKASVFPRCPSAPPSFQAFWDGALQQGFVRYEPLPLPGEAVFQTAQLVEMLAGHPAIRPRAESIELVLYEKVGIRDGRLGNNGWLHELPDPISKVTWSNYACISPALAEELGVGEGGMVSLRVRDRAITVPALIEPGVHRRVVAVAIGYGRTKAGSIGNGVGVDAFPLGLDEAGRPTRIPRGATVTRAEGMKALARSQTHGSMEGRPIVKEASFAHYLEDTSAGNEAEHGSKRHLSMWSGHVYEGHKWGMSVDLTACTGCSACVIACQAENNIPIVGEVEVLRRREMHWLRIDRYFAGTPEEPEVVHQPMMCQHCDNAPCETVCPVLATVHSSEGLNQQVYNRCVGTRYCANNCPTKVRRFNWFDYPHEDPLERMVLNPDVVVRSRGVMEKCSMCVQRIQEGKATARSQERPLRDGEIKTACEQSCPAQAITFGDTNDPGSRVSRAIADARGYHVVDEINIRPQVSYLTRIRNTEKDGRHG